MILQRSLIFMFLMLFLTFEADAKMVKYHFDIDIKSVNFTGKSVRALAINDQIPGPTIEAVVGDVLEVTFNNKMDHETSIHWHGVLLPNDQDGVPYLTTQPIAAQCSFTYHYPIIHAGTYWYHSHTGLQEQRGVYGSLVFHPKEGEREKVDQDHVIVLSDWTDEDPNQVLAHLKKDGDYYALKKGSVQSWDRVSANGMVAIKNRIKGAWSRMGPMDLSDVGYDAFLINGQKESFLDAKSGDVIRLRLINAAASSYFNVEFSGGPMMIVASDGVDVEPINVKRLRIAIAETYDVIVKMPQDRAYEFRATSEDGTGYGSLFIGSGEKVLAPDIAKPNLFLMGHKKMGHQHPSKNKSPKVIEYMTDYQSLRSLQDTSFPKDRPRKTFVLDLTGNMERYVWSFNHKTLLESSKILIKKGEVVRFILNNETMMSHPIHLHGHFFRVLNGQGKRSPLKHTVNVPARGSVEIEFAADEEKDWFFHCHNLYHLKAGMARIVSYEATTTATREVFEKLGHDTWYALNDISLLSNMTAGMLRVSNTRNSFEIEYDYNYEKEYDIDLIYARSLHRFFDLYAGVNLERQDKNDGPNNVAIMGARYMLPLLIESNLRLDSGGNVRLALGSNLQLTSRINFEWDVNTDKEYRGMFSYELNKKFLLTAGYDSDFKWGAGIRLKL